ncbi:Hypothetical protein CAP_5179 [Chondromyces apiculatus DSM 436]|uniref:Uncharacterized protein n=1 Tax=Chondromyces apiculatus DSM 436 TaxID=1192034 RepID=A0A017T3C1_9BACT|nr:Hypothetical protein CAP_5179 [Chondromyces apiculatus DSM 436]
MKQSATSGPTGMRSQEIWWAFEGRRPVIRPPISPPRPCRTMHRDSRIMPSHGRCGRSWGRRRCD